MASSDEDLRDRHIMGCPMPATYYRVVNHLFGTSADRLRALDCARGELGEFVTVADQLHQFETLAEIGPPDWGVKLGRALGMQAHGALTVAMTCAPRLRDAVVVLVEFGSARAPFLDFSARIDGGAVQVLVEPSPVVAPSIALPVIEAATHSVLALVDSSSGSSPPRGLKLRLMASRPDWFTDYSELASVVLFDQQVNAVEFSHDTYDQPNPLADKILADQAVRELRRRATRQVGAYDLVAAIQTILHYESGSILGLAEIAQRLNMSPRTLNRRLIEHGTTYRALVDGYRRDRAPVLLGKPEMTVESVAWALGYTDRSNFTRAFRRWYGRAPRAAPEPPASARHHPG